MLQIHTLRALKDNFIYVLVAGNGDCAVVDPGEAAPVEAFLRAHGLTLRLILCTHHHADHVQGAPELMARHGAELWGSAHDSGRRPVPGRPVGEDDNLTLFGEPLKILAVPGHTLGQIAFYLPSARALFVGDTVFSAGCGRLFEGSPEMMFASLQKIKALPPSTLIFIGHEYTDRNLAFVEAHGAAPAEAVAHFRQSTAARLARGEPTTPTRLGDELQINPFLRATSVAEFRHWRELRDHW